MENDTKQVTLSLKLQVSLIHKMSRRHMLDHETTQRIITLNGFS